MSKAIKAILDPIVLVFVDIRKLFIWPFVIANFGIDFEGEKGTEKQIGRLICLMLKVTICILTIFHTL